MTPETESDLMPLMALPTTRSSQLSPTGLSRHPSIQAASTWNKQLHDLMQTHGVYESADRYSLNS